MIPASNPDSESDFQIFYDSGSGFGSSKNQNCNTYRGVMVPAMDPESEFQNFGDSET